MAMMCTKVIATVAVILLVCINEEVSGASVDLDTGGAFVEDSTMQRLEVRQS